MSWELRTNKKLAKTLKSFPKKDRIRIYEVISLIAIDPYQGDIQKMEGEKNCWRRRAGSYRIFYEIFLKERIILVFKIKRRTSNTY